MMKKVRSFSRDLSLILLTIFSNDLEPLALQWHLSSYYNRAQAREPYFLYSVSQNILTPADLDNWH